MQDDDGTINETTQSFDDNNAGPSNRDTSQSESDVIIDGEVMDDSLIVPPLPPPQTEHNNNNNRTAANRNSSDRSESSSLDQDQLNFDSD